MAKRNSRMQERVSTVPAAPAEASGPRRTQEERSEQTKLRILETSARLLRGNGIGGLRTAEVAAAAGVSQGAQFHHFPNKDKLIIATIEYTNARMVGAARDHASAFTIGENPIRAIIADAKEFFMGDYFFIELSLSLSGDNNQKMVAAATKKIRQARFLVEKLWKARLHDLGLPADIAANLLDLTFNMVRGLAVRSLLDNNVDRFEELYVVWEDIMAHYIEKHTVVAVKKSIKKPGKTKQRQSVS